MKHIIAIVLTVGLLSSCARDEALSGFLAVVVGAALIDAALDEDREHRRGYRPGRHRHEHASKRRDDGYSRRPRHGEE